MSNYEPFKFVDQTHLTRGAKPLTPRRVDRLKYIVIHRLSPVIHGNPVKDAVDMGLEFCKTGKYQAGSYTNGKIPYTFVFNPDTLTVYQAAPIDMKTIHAGKYNAPGLSIAVLRDLREEPLTQEQYLALSHFTALLKAALAEAHQLKLKVVGHTELPGGSQDPKKQCPGAKLNMESFRLKVSAIEYMIGARGILLSMGMKL